MKFYSLFKNSLLIILLLALSHAVTGQNIVSRVAPGSVPPSGEGFFYTLPKTVLKIEVSFSKTTQQPGPLASFAEDYLGIKTTINTFNESYHYLHSQITSTSVTDPNQMYFVQLPIEKSKDERTLIYQMDNNSALISINNSQPEIINQVYEGESQTLIFNQESDEFSYLAGYNKKKKQDTIVRKITIDTITINRFLFKTSWVDKSEAERAEEAAQQISKIREARFNLLTGYHEVNFGQSIQYMDGQLKKMEQDYLELFLGKENTTLITQTYYFSATKENKRTQLWQSPEGMSLNLTIETDDILTGLVDFPSANPNMVYYRIPAQTKIKLTYNAKEVSTKQFTINQLGSISTAPVVKTKLQFNPQTGNLISITKD